MAPRLFASRSTAVAPRRARGRACVGELPVGIFTLDKLRVDVAVDEIRGAADRRHRDDADDDHRGDEDRDPRLPVAHEPSAGLPPARKFYVSTKIETSPATPMFARPPAASHRWSPPRRRATSPPATSPQQPAPRDQPPATKPQTSAT